MRPSSSSTSSFMGNATDHCNNDPEQRRRECNDVTGRLQASSVSARHIDLLCQVLLRACLHHGSNSRPFPLGHGQFDSAIARLSPASPTHSNGLSRHPGRTGREIRLPMEQRSPSKCTTLNTMDHVLRRQKQRQRSMPRIDISGNPGTSGLPTRGPVLVEIPVAAGKHPYGNSGMCGKPFHYGQTSENGLQNGKILDVRADFRSRMTPRNERLKGRGLLLYW